MQRGDAKSPFNHKLHLLFIIPVVAFLCALFHVQDGTAHCAPEISKCLTSGVVLWLQLRERRRFEGANQRWKVTTYAYTVQFCTNLRTLAQTLLEYCCYATLYFYFPALRGKCHAYSYRYWLLFKLGFRIRIKRRL